MDKASRPKCDPDRDPKCPDVVTGGLADLDEEGDIPEAHPDFDPLPDGPRIGERRGGVGMAGEE